MKNRTFTIFNEDGTIYGYLYGVTIEEAQEAVSNINKEEETYHYFVDGYLEEGEL